MKTTLKKSSKKTFLTLCVLLTTFDTFAITENADPKVYSLDIYQIIISLAPIALFVITTSIIFLKLKKEDYKIGDALKENETITVTSPNPDPDPANTANTETIQPKSASRLLAFISGMISVGLASTFCSFWAYNYFLTGKTADLSSITNVLLSLGLGVVPYAFNKVSKAIE
ncbi:hypothetical protein [Flavobacterium marginilacus]|uniref:hypothetical protein n=1 Tax=Flavobacterium marginilacus TaxID=3003256 RepID=UPI00248EBC5C|nr:hypothetical protein [Flavobacterium marginilacus]